MPLERQNQIWSKISLFFRWTWTNSCIQSPRVSGRDQRFVTQCSCIDVSFTSFMSFGFYYTRRMHNKYINKCVVQIWILQRHEANVTHFQTGLFPLFDLLMQNGQITGRIGDKSILFQLIYSVLPSLGVSSLMHLLNKHPNSDETNSSVVRWKQGGDVDDGGQGRRSVSTRPLQSVVERQMKVILFLKWVSGSLNEWTACVLFLFPPSFFYCTWDNWLGPACQVETPFSQRCSACSAANRSGFVMTNTFKLF